LSESPGSARDRIPNIYRAVFGIDSVTDYLKGIIVLIPLPDILNTEYRVGTFKASLKGYRFGGSATGYLDHRIPLFWSI